MLRLQSAIRRGKSTLRSPSTCCREQKKHTHDFFGPAALGCCVCSFCSSDSGTPGGQRAPSLLWPFFFYVIGYFEALSSFICRAVRHSAATLQSRYSSALFCVPGVFLSAGHDEVAATLINLSTFSIFTCLKALQLASQYGALYRLKTA